MPPSGMRILQNRYRMLRLLGAGGLGAVWLCDDLRLPGKQWAVKQLNPPDEERAERFRKTFEREAAVLAGLRHPNLPVVVDYFEDGVDCFLVMEYVEGENLAEYVRRRGPMGEREAFECGRLLLDMLAYLHAQSPPVVFRDLKPENVMRLPDGTLKLVDFGLCRPYQPGGRVDTVPSGSVGYAAPEQWEEMSRLDARSDLYSWGATMLFLLTGRRPAALNPMPDPSERSFGGSSEGAAILARCLKMRPGERYADVSSLAREVEVHLAALPSPSPSYPGGEGDEADDVEEPLSVRRVLWDLPMRLVRAPAFMLVLATVAFLFVAGGTVLRPPRPAASPLGTGVAPYQLMYKNSEEKEKARALYDRARYREAIPLLQQAAAAHPDDAEAHLLLQNARILSGAEPWVKIPFIGSLTGVDGAEGFSQLHGLVIALDEVNGRGGLKGRKVILELYDDASSTSRCLEIAEKVIKDPRCRVVIGPYNSQRALAIAPLFNAARVSLVAPVASSSAVWEAGAYVFSASDSTQRRVRALARFVVAAGHRRIATVVDDTSRLSGEMARLFGDEVEAIAREGGPQAEVVPIQPYQEGAGDFSPQTAAIARERPDIVFLCDYRAVTTALFARQARAAGVRTPVCSQTVPFTPELVQEGGSAVEGLLLPAYFHPDLDTPAVRAFVTAFHARFGTLTPTHLAANTYDAFMAVFRALENDPSRDGVQRFLYEVGRSRPPFDGVMGPFATSRQLDARPVWIIEVAGGRYRLVEEARGMTRR